MRGAASCEAPGLHVVDGQLVQRGTVRQPEGQMQPPRHKWQLAPAMLRPTSTYVSPGALLFLICAA